MCKLQGVGVEEKKDKLYMFTVNVVYGDWRALAPGLRRHMSVDVGAQGRLGWGMQQLD
jgi:hypothetical protein